MSECYKCGVREAKDGGLCDKCGKGAYLGISSGFDLSRQEGLSFEEFQETYLNDIPDVQAISMADDELILYEYYKKHGIFVPNLKHIAGRYEPEYLKMNEWFSKKFFTVLRERISPIDPQALNEDYFSEVERSFMQFRSKINKIVLDLSDERIYIGTADLNPVILFLKKVIRKRDIVPDCVDVTGNIFIPGSGMFFLELFATLKDKDILQKIQQDISKMNTDDAWELIRSPLVLLIPWDHQQHAFDRWSKTGKRGIIEMATATGKTLVGLMAVELLSQSRENAIVRIFAHSQAILNQWRRECIEKLGLIADVNCDFTTPISCGGLKIYFNTLQSVYKQPEDFPSDLLIVDEVHHTAAFEYRKALAINCNWKIGLSATVEGEVRTNILERDLGPIVYRFSLLEALEKGVLPNFEWKLHTVHLSIPEEKEFEDISKKIRMKFLSVSNDHVTIKRISKEKTTIEDLHDFIKMTEKARYENIQLPNDWRILQSYILQRRWIIHRSRPKLDSAIKLAKQYAAHNKVIIFAMDIATCNTIASELEKENDNIFLVHSEIEEDANKQILRFKNVKYGALIGARMLDEGIDIPDAEIGINVSSSKTRLQLVQRMGRILRKKKDKKPVFHHYIALPKPEYYLQEEDNLTFLDDLSWVQETALRMGVHAELEQEEVPFERLRLNAEEMIRKRYFDRKLTSLPGYGTFRLDYVLRLFPASAKNNIISQLNCMESNHKISDVEWSNILRKGFCKNVEDQLNIPGHWWLLILGGRNPLKIKQIFTEQNIG